MILNLDKGEVYIKSCSIESVSIRSVSQRYLLSLHRGCGSVQSPLVKPVFRTATQILEGFGSVFCSQYHSFKMFSFLIFQLSMRSSTAVLYCTFYLCTAHIELVRLTHFLYFSQPCNRWQIS